MSDEQHFQHSLEALNGRKFPLIGGASKVLNFMLVQNSGCDCEIGSGRFEIRFGWHRSRHRYFESLAPSAISALMNWGDVAAIKGPSQFQVRGSTVPHAETFPSWSFGSRAIWVRPSPEVIRIVVRDASQYSSELPEPIPDPVTEPPVFLSPEPPMSCPHCGEVGERYRVLSDALVCLSCGRSFDYK